MRKTMLVVTNAVGLDITYVILVEIEQARLEALETFHRKIHAESRVQKCDYITGDADFALVALASDMSNHLNVIKRLFFDDFNVKRSRACVFTDRTKVESLALV